MVDHRAAYRDVRAFYPLPDFAVLQFLYFCGAGAGLFHYRGALCNRADFLRAAW